jgi:hypothetical protein
VVTAIAVQAAAATWAGACLGARFTGEGATRVRWGSERLAGMGPVALAAFLIADRRRNPLLLGRVNGL